MTDAIAALGSSAVENALAAYSGYSASKVRSEAEVSATASNFESMFMTQMLQPMFESVEVDPMFGGGAGEEAMRGFLVQEYGKAVAAGDRSGLSDALKSDILRLQNEADRTTAGGAA